MYWCKRLIKFCEFLCSLCESIMDNPLTPNKIQKLINLAEGRTFIKERLLLTEDDVKLISATQANVNNSLAKYESSSGILDLDHMDAFGESGCIANMSLSKSTAFNPGEMTGRSTGTEEPSKSTLDAQKTQQYGRHSIGLDSIFSEMDKQTSEINEIMRHSIATNSNYSFHSKRDLTADEASLIAREAPLPILQTTRTYFADSTSANTSSVSVGAYFKNRCVDFGNILTKTDSPDRSNMMPSITEVSNYEHPRETNLIKLDDMLDCVPVRQPRNTDLYKADTPTASLTRTDRINKTLFKEPMRVVEKLDTSRIPQKPTKTVNHAAVAHKPFMSSSKPADVLLKNLHTSFKMVTEETEGSMENSFSISKIADYLGNQSNVSVTDMMQLQKRPVFKKQPLTELNVNTQENIQVTNLIDSKKAETASSAGTINTVVSLDKLKIHYDVPEVIISQDNQTSEGDKRVTRSKSPSSKSPSTLSTVRDNCSSFKSGDSLNSSKGEANRSKLPSPNIAYKELDKSVDWQEVLQQKRIRQRAVTREHWVEIVTNAVEGFVGVSTTVTISITTLSDSWLMTKFQFDHLPNEGKDVNIELPRLPKLLSPRKSEDFTFYMTFNVEMDTILPFTFYVKDASLEGEVAQKGELKVKFRIPSIQAMSADGLNKLTFQPIQEKQTTSKTFVLLSDCPADLQIKLIINEGDSLFSIKSVQEIRKADVNKAILEQGVEDKSVKAKAKMNKQLCRLVSGNALRVVITFDAPRLADLNIQHARATFTGALNVTLITGNTVLKKVDLIGFVASPAELAIKAPENKIKVTKERTEISLTNVGGVPGSWSVKYKPQSPIPAAFPFLITPLQFHLAAGEAKTLQLAYTGPEDSLTELSIRFEENKTGNGTDLILIGGFEKPRSFPIKSNHNSLSWVRAGRKEVSLKNDMDKKVHIRCHIDGDGFSIDLPGGEARGVYVLSFNGYECRPLPILFNPTTSLPQKATLHLAYDRNSEYCRKIKLFGDGSVAALRWAGVVTFSETAALVRAAGRAPLDLRLRNAAAAPAFAAAAVRFNLQYSEIAKFSRLMGAYKVIPGRSSHTISLRVDWPRVERRAREANTTALATVTVLTGAEATRRRILKIFKDESTGKVDISQLPDHLKALAKEYEGEDASSDNLFKDFDEPKTALSELTGGLRELTAHIDLPQDFADETTIIISDDTVVEHHTLLTD